MIRRILALLAAAGIIWLLVSTDFAKILLLGTL